MFEEGDEVSAAAQNSATFGHIENLNAKSTWIIIPGKLGG